MNYQQQTLAVMDSVELVVVLYDGVVRFLHRAITNVEAGDVAGRRESIRRVLEILTYLQARLRADVGGKPAAALSEFYAAIYAQSVRASRDASIPLLEQTIRDVLNVRDAWKQVAAKNARNSVQPAERTLISASAMPRRQGESFPRNTTSANASMHPANPVEAESRRWSA